MKKKLSSILGVSLALVLAFTLVGGFMPANQVEAQAYTPNQWNNMPIPTGGGRVLVPAINIVDFAVASDGTTIYAVNNSAAVAGYAVTTHSICKSTNGGRTFTWLTLPATYLTVPKLVAVAPDDPETVAIVDTASGGAGADWVWISKTGGATWVNLGDPLASAGAAASATSVISDITVSPLRAGTILERDYVVCTLDTASMAANGPTGDIYMVGASTTWAGQCVGAGVKIVATGVGFDFTSVALSHNWVGERAIIAIGSDNIAGGNAEAGTTAGDTWLIAINANPVVGPVLCGPQRVRLDTATHDSPCEWRTHVQSAEICSSSLALPSDFDSTGVGNFRAFLGWTSFGVDGAQALLTNADDAYRVDFNSPRKLEIRSAVAIESVSYSGTVASGTLFASESRTNVNGVHFTSDPGSGLPSWSFTYKGPTSTATAVGWPAVPRTKVVLAPDFTESNVVYGCCQGADVAFSKSEDGGTSFNGISLIDEAIVVVNDVMPTPSGEYLFMTTEDAVPNHSIWRCPDRPSIARWDRVGFRTNAAAQFPGGASIIRVSPDWTDDSTAYWFNTGGTNIRKSTSNGQIWSGRTAGAAVVDATIESQDIVYHTSGANVYKSINGAWSFGLPQGAGIGALSTIAMAPTYPHKPVADNILVGGTGMVGLSTNGGAGFNPMFTWPFTGVMQLLADAGYADNNIVYAGSSTASEGVYRYEVGVSSAWEQIQAYTDVDPAAAVTAGECNGLAMLDTELYAEANVSAAAPISSAYRALFPTAPAPLWTWDQLDIGATALTFNRAPSALRICGSGVDVYLYAIDTVANALWSYHDTMTEAAVEANVPANVPYDPNTRGTSQFFITWGQISNATAYHAEIYADAACSEFVWSAGTAALAVPATNTAYGPSNPAAPSWVVLAGTLSPGQDYYFKVRACNQVPTDAIRSQWSEVLEFTAEAGVPIEVPYPSPQLLGPPPGATGSSITPGFAWGAFHGAVSYEFELSTDPGTTARGYFVDALKGLTGDNALPSTAWQCDITLDYATNYYWHVKAITATGETPWSTGVFTTMSVAEVPLPPAPPVELPAPITPAWIWAIVVIGAILVIVVVVLIVVTRKP